MNILFLACLDFVIGPRMTLPDAMKMGKCACGSALGFICDRLIKDDVEGTCCCRLVGASVKTAVK